MITISNKPLFKIYTLSVFFLLFSLLCIALFENTFSILLFLIISPILTIASSIYFVRKKLIKEDKKILFILPSIGFIVALILSILLQIYLVIIDPFHSDQISLDMIWPFFSIFYIFGTIFVNIIIASLLFFLLKYDKIEFNETTVDSRYRISLLSILGIFIFMAILFTPEFKNIYYEIKIQKIINTLEKDKRIDYCDQLDSLVKKDYCFRLIGEVGLSEYLDKQQSIIQD